MSEFVEGTACCNEALVADYSANHRTDKDAQGNAWALDALRPNVTCNPSTLPPHRSG